MSTSVPQHFEHIRTETLRAFHKSLVYERFRTETSSVLPPPVYVCDHHSDLLCVSIHCEVLCVELNEIHNKNQHCYFYEKELIFFFREIAWWILVGTRLSRLNFFDFKNYHVEADKLPTECGACREVRLQVEDAVEVPRYERFLFENGQSPKVGMVVIIAWPLMWSTHSKHPCVRMYKPQRSSMSLFSHGLWCERRIQSFLVWEWTNPNEGRCRCCLLAPDVNDILKAFLFGNGHAPEVGAVFLLFHGLWCDLRVLS